MEALAVTEPVAAALDLAAPVVRRVLQLFAGGATVPFVARYRKEATSGLDEVQLRAIEERARYFRELEQRRQTILQQVRELGHLDAKLEAALLACRDKTELEDLYSPFKPKRRTKATIARERGLEPLARCIESQEESTPPERKAQSFVDKGRDVPDVQAALEGAVDICAEWIADDKTARSQVRDALERGQLTAKKRKEFRDQATKYDNYADYAERVRQIAPHRILALRRGEEEGVLQIKWEFDTERCLAQLERQFCRRGRSPWTVYTRRAVEEALSRLLLPSARTHVRAQLHEQAEHAAVEVFARNLRGLLLSPPFGAQWVLGIDPGQRTGCKCAVVDDTGALKEHTVLHLVRGEKERHDAEQTLRRLLARFPIRAVAIGNGTHGRETEKFVRDTLRTEAKSRPGNGDVVVVSVNEAGASVYSASDVARREFPDHDITVRGAVSIARRLQDPLAELVKVDPKSIGVGQYQHDVSASLLSKKLREVVESCVNGVGVELNTASPSLLAYVSGIGPKLAEQIVEHRDRNGRFKSRQQLLQVKGLGARTFEQAAGFLRIRDGDHPLDNTGVHPERYELVERMARATKLPLARLLGNESALATLRSDQFLEGDAGVFTWHDILDELRKPGRDPREKFEAPEFRDDVNTLEDLREGMVLNGKVTNVTAFGAFVDVGVHQDGLVHISELANRFVKDPNEVVSVGDWLEVRVLSVDLARRRISLSAKSTK